MAVRLGVNIDHVATLRQARGTAYPDILDAARCCEAAGAHQITVHLREDRRHIQDRDVKLLRRELRVPMNLEMANAEPIVRIALALRPAEVCIVPERRQELTTEGGLDVLRYRRALAGSIRRLASAGVRVSLFIEPDPDQVRASGEVGAPAVELHTGRYASCRGREAARELRRLACAAVAAHGAGLTVNAGHGLHVGNIAGVVRAVPHLDTLNIGHSIVCRAVLVGMAEAVRETLAAIRESEP